MSKKAGEKTPPAVDPNNPATPPAGDPPAADPPAAEPPAADPPEKKKEKTFTKAEVDAAAAKAVKDAQDKWDDEKNLTEVERLKKENAALVEANRLRDAKEEVVEALKKAGAKAADLAFDAIQGKLKFDDAGKLVNAKDLIDGLKTSYPDQFGVEPPAGGIEGGAGQKDGTGTKLTKEKLAAMTPTEINALDWKEVSAVMAEK